MKKKKWFIGVATAAACAVIALTSGVASSRKSEAPVYAAGTSVDLSKDKVVVSWNTKPDGSGKSFQSNQNIGKMTKDNPEVKDYLDENGNLDLYAQWKSPEFTATKSFLDGMDKVGCTVVADQYDGTYGLKCDGSCKRDTKLNDQWPELFYSTGDYVGAIFKMDVTDYSKMTFYAKQVAKYGMIGAYIYDSSGNYLPNASVYRYHNAAGITEWNQYTADLSDVSGTVTILLEGGWGDFSGGAGETIFSDIQFTY